MAKILQFRRPNSRISDKAHQELLDLEEVVPTEIYDTHLERTGAVYKLRLELEETAEADFSESRQDQWKLLQKYGKVEKSISREILAPGDMDLHAFHYAILRLFGWQNSHLHKFYLSDEDFELMTAGRMDTYSHLAGTIFRFPAELEEYEYWDDDYENGMNFNTWLKSKYRRPFMNLNPHDTFLGNTILCSQFLTKHPDLDGDQFLNDIYSRMYSPANWNTLMESRQLSDLLVKMPDHEEKPSVKVWKSNAMFEASDLFSSLREEEEELEEEMTEEMMAARLFMTDVSVFPYFSTIYYAYDFGDNWHVKISVEEVYYPEYEFLDEDEDWDGLPEDDDFDEDDFEEDEDAFDEEDDDETLFEDDLSEEEWLMEMLQMTDEEKEYAYLDANQNKIEGEILPLIQKVDNEGIPVCIAADGLNVMDDCGGPRGYINFLSTIHGSDREEARSMREWGRGQGWTGRKTRTDRML